MRKINSFTFFAWHVIYIFFPSSNVIEKDKGGSGSKKKHFQEDSYCLE